AGVLAHGGGDGGESHRTPVELLDDRLEDTPVHVVETELVYVQALEGFPRYLRRDLAAGAHLGVVADPLQQPVRDAGRPATAAGDFGDACDVRGDAQDPSRAADDLRQVVRRIVGEALYQPEARA